MYFIILFLVLNFCKLPHCVQIQVISLKFFNFLLPINKDVFIIIEFLLCVLEKNFYGWTNHEEISIIFIRYVFIYIVFSVFFFAEVNTVFEDKHIKTTRFYGHKQIYYC
jgi:hypothetical protein